MDLERDLFLYIENKPVLHGQKLMLVAQLMQNPQDELLGLIKTEFRELVEAGFDGMCREAGLMYPALNFQAISDRLMEEEKALIHAGEYQDLPAALIVAEVQEEQFKDAGWLSEELAKHFSKEEKIDTEEKPEKLNEMVQEIREDLDYSGEWYPDSSRAEFKYDGTEYSVIRSEEMAETIAKHYVKEMLDSEPENFTWTWLQQHLYVNDLDKRLIATDEANAYIGDMDDDQIMSDYADDEQKEKYESLQAEHPEQARELLQQIREAAEEKYHAQIEDRLTNDLAGYLDDLGYEPKEPGLLDRATFVRIDTDEAAQDAVNTDGWAHFLAHYDGNYETISDGMVLFRKD